MRDNLWNLIHIKFHDTAVFFATRDSNHIEILNMLLNNSDVDINHNNKLAI